MDPWNFKPARDIELSPVDRARSLRINPLATHSRSQRCPTSPTLSTRRRKKATHFDWLKWIVDHLRALLL